MKAETAQIAFDLAGVALSAGSACSSGKVGPSHVLKAMGYGDEPGRLARVDRACDRAPRISTCSARRWRQSPRAGASAGTKAA